MDVKKELGSLREELKRKASDAMARPGASMCEATSAFEAYSDAIELVTRVEKKLCG